MEAFLVSLRKVPYKQVCVWRVSVSGDGGQEEEDALVKGLIPYKAVSSFTVDQVDTVTSLCKYNVIVTVSPCRGLLASSLPLTVHHHYYVLYPLLQQVDTLCSAQFGVAQASFVSLLDGRVFSLSSPLFPQRKFVASNLSLAFKNERMSRVNLKGSPVTIATFNCTPFVVFTQENKNNLDSLTGIEWQVLTSMAELMNFTIRLVELKGPALWGHLLENGSYTGGITGAIHEGEAEIAICNLWFTRDSYKIMDFSAPLNMIQFTFTAPRPRRLQHNWRALVQVFDKKVWSLVLLLYIFCVMCYWKFASADSKNKSRHGLVKGFVTMFGVLMGTHWPSPGGHGSARLLVTLWCVFVLLLTSTYNTSIASRLTLQGYEQRIDTVQQLVEGGFYWSDDPDNDHSKRDVYFNMANEWQRRWKQRYVPLPTSRLRDAVRSGKFSIPVQRWGGKLIFVAVPGLDLDRDVSHLRAIQETTTTTFTSLMYAKRSPLYYAGQRVLLRVFEAGLVNFWSSVASLYSHPQRLLRDERVRSSAALKKLGMNNLWPVFFILGLGLFVSLNIFMFEYLFKRRRPCIMRQVCNSGD